MHTVHRIHYCDAADMAPLESGSVQLVVTSPPYPMIEMWDGLFCRRDPDIGRLLAQGTAGRRAFEAMHRQLDPVWHELFRVLAPGGLACINIGDATRSVNGRFGLHANHTRIQTALQQAGFTPLPAILWRKPTNAPNKFMGSGMLPAGAYVTLEHEYILIARKGGKRVFASESDKRRRRESAYFWEDRNHWFSDVWTGLIGTRQALTDAGQRRRSGAFPLDLPFRLICMFSVKGDTVLDPFMGLGTTMLAAMAAARNSVGFEIDENLAPAVTAAAGAARDEANDRIGARLDAHCRFVAQRTADGKPPPKHVNRHYGFPVITRQEVELRFDPVAEVAARTGGFRVDYDPSPPPDLSRACRLDGDQPVSETIDPQRPIAPKRPYTGDSNPQRSLWED
ncbi:MAG: DNA-methyltransferase [Anaerolineae bacterium]